MKPFSEACEQNKRPILAVLREVFASCSRVLEIGSGTGQHAAYFAPALPHLTWYATDLPGHHAGIAAWLADSEGTNTRGPLTLDVDESVWPVDSVDAVFSANTTHIMHWPSVVNMFAGIGRVLDPGGCFALYGPFNYRGEYTSASNAQFDRTILRARDPGSGLRDFEALDELAAGQGMTLWHDYEMPVNNRTLVWRMRPS